MKLIFMGTPQFSIFPFEALIKAGHEISCVYTQPPRPAGRGQKEKESPIHILAEEQDIKVRTPQKLDEEEVKKLLAEDVDYIIVVAYGLILPKDIVEQKKCLNIHASLLPRWRGAAPIQRAIMAGDEKSGITIINMDPGLDTGDMILTKEMDLGDDMIAGDLHDELSVLGAEAIVEALEKIDFLEPKSQNDEGATYAKKIDKSEYEIDFNDSIWNIGRKIRAFSPMPGAYFTYKTEKIKILKAAKEESEQDVAPATVVDDNLGIKCADGIIRPLIVQRAGKKPMTAQDMLRGFDIPEGVCF